MLSKCIIRVRSDYLQCVSNTDEWSGVNPHCKNWKKIRTCHHENALGRHSAAINCIQCSYPLYLPCLYYIIFTSTSAARTLTACGREIRTDVNKNCDIISLSSSSFLFLHFYCEICRFSIENDISVPLFLSRHVRNLQASWKSGPKRFLAFFIHNIVFYVLLEYEYLYVHRSGFGRWNTFVFFF